MIHDFTGPSLEDAIVGATSLEVVCARQLGHLYPTKAQVAGLEIIEASESNPTDPGVQHPVTQDFLGPSSGHLRQELERFSRG